MIACVSVPYFAATVERRDPCAAGPAELGLVIGGQPWEPQPVYAFSHEAAQQGVKPGMSLRLAHVLSPEAHFMAADPPRYHNVSAEVAGVLMDFTHLIEIEALWSPNIKQATSRPRSGPGVAFGRRLPASYTLDLESLPPAEALALSQEMGRQVRRQTQLTPAVGLAKSKFVAQVAATLARPNHARSITADEEGSFLASQPVHFLPLDKETARRLSLLGLHTLGQLAALPQASIRKLLGPSLAPDSPAGEGFTQFYRLVQERSGRRNLGDDLFLSVKADPPAGQEQIVYRFDGPVIDILVLERVVDQAATELAGRLQRSGLEGRTLQLILGLEGGRESDTGPLAPSLSCRGPTANPRLLTSSLHGLLSQAGRDLAALSEGARAGVSCLTVILSDLTPATARQLSLFDQPRITERFHGMLQDILAKHKAGCFFQPALTDPGHPLPERRFQLQEFTPA
ncbi:MAG TPA: hypothetical protein VLE70_02250 [Anaerolineae bacterium]|nr:hypothetical protein [Anaerolineae bacterium]